MLGLYIFCVNNVICVGNSGVKSVGLYIFV